MIERVLRRMMGRLARRGDLTVVFASGASFRVGDGTGAPISIRFADRAAPWALAIAPDPALGELYMDGRLLIEQGDVYALLDLLLRDADRMADTGPIRALARLRRAARRLAPRNNPRRAQRNVTRHYDLDGRLYDLFLDADRQYSCAYFETPEASLEEAQAAKRRHIAAKLLVRPGSRVLDIGCGWGGLCRYLVAVAGAGRARGVTLSAEQLAVARQGAEAAGLGDRVEFALQDYRAVGGVFDRIVSVGMFEHVGADNWRRFFEVCRDRLAEDGAALLHTIGFLDGPYVTSPFITRRVFPGAQLPALSELMAAIEGTGLIVTDVEVLRLHYAFTLRAWRRRFLARRDETEALYGARFARMWEFYLAACEAAFRYRGLAVYQVQFARRLDAVPLTRGYVEREEKRLLEAERRGRPAAQAAAE
jgi:cyclopropane-fatty-acyl-phospholipid synthase